MLCKQLDKQWSRCQQQREEYHKGATLIIVIPASVAVIVSCTITIRSVGYRLAGIACILVTCHDIPSFLSCDLMNNGGWISRLCMFTVLTLTTLLLMTFRDVVHYFTLQLPTICDMSTQLLIVWGLGTLTRSRYIPIPIPTISSIMTTITITSTFKSSRSNMVPHFLIE